MPKPSKSLLKERDVQSQILEWLQLKGIFCYRNNVGGMKKGKSFIKFGVKGAPDIVCILRGQFVGIEVKRPGESQSVDQVAFQNAVVFAGGGYVLATSLKDVMQAVG